MKVSNLHPVSSQGRWEFQVVGECEGRHSSWRNRVALMVKTEVDAVSRLLDDKLESV
jgi:hypothetical protein